jgi:RNA polymerase sigma-B factor
VLEAFEAGKMFNSQSLDEKLDINSDDSDMSLMDIVGQEDTYFIKIENEDFIEKSLDKLNELERKIIIKRFYSNKTQSEIAKELNISQMTVSRIEKRSLEKLRIEFNK